MSKWRQDWLFENKKVGANQFESVDKKIFSETQPNCLLSTNQEQKLLLAQKFPC